MYVSLFYGVYIMSSYSSFSDPGRPGGSSIGGACLNSLYPIGTMWVGTTRSGNPKQFRDFSLYRQYLTNTGCPDVSRTAPPRVTKEEQTPFTGFMEFKPADSYQESLYSAMSPYWVGPDREEELPLNKVSR